MRVLIIENALFCGKQGGEAAAGAGYGFGVDFEGCGLGAGVEGSGDVAVRGKEGGGVRGKEGGAVGGERGEEFAVGGNEGRAAVVLAVRVVSGTVHAEAVGLVFDGPGTEEGIPGGAALHGPACPVEQHVVGRIGAVAGPFGKT